MALHPSLSAPLPPLLFPLQPYDDDSSPTRQRGRRSFHNSRSGWTSIKIAGLVIVLTACILAFLFLGMSFATVGIRYCRASKCNCLRSKDKEEEEDEVPEGEGTWWASKVMYPIMKEETKDIPRDVQSSPNQPLLLNIESNIESTPIEQE